jgi:hypothetical protein
MWLHLSIDIKKIMKFAEYAGLLQWGYLLFYLDLCDIFIFCP